MKSFFEFKKIIFYSPFLLFISLFVGLEVFLLGIFILLSIYFLLRIEKTKSDEEHLKTENIIFSPINGKVVDIFKNEKVTIVKMAIPYFLESSVRFPCDGEIEKVQIKKNSFWRYGKIFESKNFENVSQVQMRLKNKRKLKIFFENCYLGGKFFTPSTVGDLGELGAFLGFFPFGGAVYLNLDREVNVLIKKGDVIKSSETPIATFEINK